VHRLWFGIPVRWFASVQGYRAKVGSTGEEEAGNRFSGGERESPRGEERQEGISGGSVSAGPFGLPGGIKPPESRWRFGVVQRHGRIRARRRARDLQVE